MTDPDPKLIALETFAEPESLIQGIDIIGRFATDSPVTNRTLIEAISEGLPSGGRVAELGFGSGWLLEELGAQLSERELYALDLSHGNARRAHELYGDRGRVLNGDTERLPFRDGAFDVIVTCWTLYFMRDIDMALREIRRCLTRSGRLIVATSARDHESEMVALAAQAVRNALKR